MGSQLCRSLARKGHEVMILDNFSSSTLSDLRDVLDLGVALIEGDCKNPREVKRALANAKIVFHFAANPEVRLYYSDPSTCFSENVYATHVLFEQVKRSEAETIVFASSSTVYGEARLVLTPENYTPLEPISVYGASKLASEALISAYCHTYGKKGVILRFANIVGPNNGHGVIRDFLTELMRNPERLKILGDGHQSKSYLHVDDCISAILEAIRMANGTIDVFNIGSEDQIEVTRIAKIVREETNLNEVPLEFAGEALDGKGWKGDVKNMLLDISKLKSNGWRPRYSSEEAVRLIVRSALSYYEPRISSEISS